jgi:Auxin binding protein
MKVIHHKDRPLLEFPDEPWRPSLRMAVNRSAGADQLSIWLHDFEGQKRAPLHRHDTEEVLVFFDVEGDGFVRVGDEVKRASWFRPEPFTASGCAARER